MYYFDYASTTKPDDDVLKVYEKISKEYFLHPYADKQTNKLLEDSKLWILNSLNLDVNNYEVIYTSGGTEANNLAAIGYAKRFSEKKHFITSKIEHSSMYDAFEEIKRLGHEVDYIGVDSNGFFDEKELLRLIKANTVLISLMCVNNEIGTVQKVSEICKQVKEENNKVIFLTDAVQALGKINYEYSNFDMMTFSGHKINAPKSIGCLVKKKEIDLKKVIFGGSPDNKFRGGTQSLPLEVCYAYAFRKAQNQIVDTQNSVNEKLKYLISCLEEIDKVEINTIGESGIVSINLNVKPLGESLKTILQDKDIYISTRSACSSKSSKKSRILEALEIPDEKIERTLRISISKETTKKEIDYLIQTLKEISLSY